MSTLLTVLLIVQVISSLSIIVLVLLQQGKGADMGSSFGSGSAGSLFGASGAANFLSRTTKWAAVVFFASTAGLAYMSHSVPNAPGAGGVMDTYEDRSVPAVPGQAAPAPAGAGEAAVPQAPGQSPSTDVPAAPAQPGSSSVPAAPEAPQPGATPAAPADPAPSTPAPAAQ